MSAHEAVSTQDLVACSGVIMDEDDHSTPGDRMTVGTRRGFEALTERPYADVLIIGGGINGLATFRDLAMQGVDVALVERADFVSGASAASSHMIHGGIRYLENGEFRLVHESVTERNGLLQTAAHYVRPLQTTIPIYSTFSGVLGAPLRFLRHGGGAPPSAAPRSSRSGWSSTTRSRGAAVGCRATSSTVAGARSRSCRRSTRR